MAMFDDFTEVSVVWLFSGSSLHTLQNTKHLRKHIRYLDAVVGCAMLACDQLEQLQQPTLKYVRSRIFTLQEEIPDLFRKFHLLEQITTFQNVCMSHTDFRSIIYVSITIAKSAQDTTAHLHV